MNRIDSLARVLVSGDQRDVYFRMKQQDPKQLAPAVTRPSQYACLDHLLFPCASASFAVLGELCVKGIGCLTQDTLTQSSQRTAKTRRLKASPGSTAQAARHRSPRSPHRAQALA